MFNKQQILRFYYFSLRSFIFFCSKKQLFESREKLLRINSEGVSMYM